MEVPTAYVKRKAVDYDTEILSILGHGYRVGKWHFRPPSIAVWSMWEVIDSPVIKGLAPQVGDYWRVLWLNDQRRDALPLLAQWVADGKPARANTLRDMHPMDMAILKWSRTVPVGAMIEDGQRKILAVIQASANGYEMIPKGEDPGLLYLFAGEALGRAVMHDLAAWDAILWDVPMVLLSHVAARQAVHAGQNGVTRPFDEDDIRLQLRLARERDAAGEIHQWQLDHPDVFPLSANQAKNENTVRAWTEAKSAKEKKVSGSQT